VEPRDVPSRPGGRAHAHDRRRWGIALTLTFVLGVSACGDDDATTTSGASTSAAPSTAAPSSSATATSDVCTSERVGGELTMSLSTMSAGLDPTVSTGSGTTGAIELSALYGTLMHWDPETREFVPGTAKSLTPNDDFTEWTLELRPDVTFGNGKPMTTADVEANILRHQDPANRSVLIADTRNITSMDVVDDHTMVFHLNEPWGSFPYLLGDLAGMIADPDVIEERGKEAFNRDPSGAGVGPYELVSYQPGQTIVMKAKEDWWGGPVCIEQLRFVDIPTEQATVDALKLGEIDMAFSNTWRYSKEIRDAGFEHYLSPQHMGGLIMLYSKDPALPTANVLVRQAIAAATDTALIDQRIDDGNGMPASTIIHPDSPLSPGVTGPAYDPAKARDLVARAKAEGWDGRIELLCSTSRQELAITLQGLWDSVGMTTDVDIVETNEWISRVYVQPNYQATCGAAVVNEAAPSVRMWRWFGPDNRFTGFHDPDFDAGLRELKAAATLEQSKAALATLQEIWNEQVPSVAIGASGELVAWSDRVHGLTFSENTTALFDKAYVTD